MPESLTHRPRGNGAMALVHWRFFYWCLFPCWSNTRRTSTKRLRKTGSNSDTFDSHCHFDRTMREWGVHTESLDEINSHTPLENNEVRLVGVVGISCDPETYPTPESVKV